MYSEPCETSMMCNFARILFIQMFCIWQRCEADTQSRCNCQAKYSEAATEVFYNKSFFKNFAISTGKHLSWSLFLIKTCNFIKKRLQHRCFSWISRNLQQHILWKTFANGCFRMLYIWSISSFLGITDASYQYYYFYNQSNNQPMMM